MQLPPASLCLPAPPGWQALPLPLSLGRGLGSSEVGVQGPDRQPQWTVPLTLTLLGLTMGPFPSPVNLTSARFPKPSAGPSQRPPPDDSSWRREQRWVEEGRQQQGEEQGELGARRGPAGWGWRDAARTLGAAGAGAAGRRAPSAGKGLGGHGARRWPAR